MIREAFNLVVSSSNIAPLVKIKFVLLSHRLDVDVGVCVVVVDFGTE